MAPISLHFTVVGASVAGLTAAYGLAASGHKVTVLEKQPKTAQVGRFNLPPRFSS